jgi:AcrR family transcriptional regulator
MTSKRSASETSSTRAAILIAAYELMVENGYAAVTARNIAAKAKFKSNLLHYYFRTMDELFVELYRGLATDYAEQRKKILAEPRPLSALWEVTSDPKNVTIIYEFVALGNHRKEIRAEIAKYGNALRALDLQIVTEALNRKGLGWIPWLPSLVTIVLESVARSQSLQQALGVTSGRDEAMTIIQRAIDLLEG